MNPVNRAALEPVDAIIGAGDLEPDFLAMLADAYRVPLLYVLGNHDRGLGWKAYEDHLPEPMTDARVENIGDLRIAGLSWPGARSGRPEHDDRAAWRQVLRLGLMPGRQRPSILVSHAPPEGAGDDPSDPYHRGYRAYRWLAARLKPKLWLHGHTTVATQKDLISRLGDTCLINVTGSVLIELDPSAPPGECAELDTRGQAARSSA
jgi:Icc-related predicted phosphoesterase